MIENNRGILVLGGGISGITASIYLAQKGINVYLVEKNASIGGHAAHFCCKSTVECNKCSVCLYYTRKNEISKYSNISILTNSELKELDGEAGNFQARIIKKPRFVDEQKCIACGLCTEVCPAKPSKAIYLPMIGAIPFSYAIDAKKCLHLNGKECSACQDKCPAEAIDYEQKVAETKIEVDAIIVATGFQVFDAKRKSALGYGKIKNVVTGFDLENTFNLYGTFTLPSNGMQPENVAFIQCVGSRDENIGNGYCSQVCCKYAIRLANLLHYQNPKSKVSMFYMDLQTAGKGFGEFYERNKNIINFIRGMPVAVSELTPNQVEVKYEDFAKGKVSKGKYDLVVLSVGITPSSESNHLAGKLGINVGEYGFFGTQEPFDKVKTNIEGIYLAGTCQGPRDIADSIAHATQATSKVVQIIGQLSSEVVGCKQE